MCVHVCACVHVCSCVCMHGIALSSELALGKGGNAYGGRTWDAESGRGLWLVSAAQGWIGLGERAAPMLGARLASSSSKHPLHQARAANLLPAAGTAVGHATELHPLLSPCPTGREGAPFVSNLLSLPTQCFELCILKKQPQSIVCTGEGFGSLLWAGEETSPGLQLKTVTVSEKKKSSPFYFKTADSNTMQYMLFFVSGRCV